MNKIVTLSFFHAFVQKAASSRPGAWFYARNLHNFERVVFKLSGGRATMTDALAGCQWLS